ncbi:MAG: TonB-dependent receptor [Bacteroidota bacterium]
MKGILFSILLIGVFWSSTGYAQEGTYTASGSLINSKDKTPLVGATVLMVNVKDSLRSKYAIADANGNFLVSGLEKAFYRIRVNSLGYITYTKLMRIAAPETQLGIIQVEPDLVLLEGVEIEGEIIAVQQIGDTTQYNADAFKTNPDASAKDLVTKMPGIVVDNSGVSANGESVDQVLLDGKRFFGQDPLLSLNTIPAEIVDKVQVYDEESDQAQLTGFDDGNSSLTMNLVTKKDKRNGLFGDVYAGAGENELYKAGATINSFNNDQRLTFLGISNNINQQNFSSEDLIGLSGGGGRGGGRRGANQNFISGTQDGITSTNSIGLNFTDDWGKKTTFEGSYFFNQSTNNNDQVLSRETFLPDFTQLYEEDQRSVTDNLNHRLNARLRHEFNDDNILLTRTSFSLQDNQSEQRTLGTTSNDNGERIGQTFNQYETDNDAINFDNTFIYQHRFDKVGRTLSLDVNTRYNPRSGFDTFEDLERDSLVEYNTDEENFILGSSVSFTEPVGTSGQLTLSYDYDANWRSSDVETFSFDEGGISEMLSSDLSNNLISTYHTNTPTVRYSNNKYGNIIDLSVAYEYAELDNVDNTVFGTNNRNFGNFLFSALARRDFSKGGNFFARYATSTTAPSVSQLQNVIDNRDPLFVSVGNPLLDQSYTHALDFRYKKTYGEKNTTLTNRTSIRNTSNYIGTSTEVLSADSVTAGGVELARGAQLNKPVNLDGYWNVRNNTTFGTMISPIRNNLSITAGLSYTRLPGLTDDISNISETYSADLRIGLASNISEKVDYNVYYQLSRSDVKNSIFEANDNQFYTQTVGASLNLTLPYNIVFRNETLFQKYDGVNDDFDTEYTLWNMGVAKKFLKDNRAEIELSVYDLLGQNESFNQTVTAQYLEETQTQVLQRYFMLTFTYQLRMFK